MSARGLILALAALLLLPPTLWPQGEETPDPLDTRLERLEHRLDELLREEVPPPQAPARRPAKPRRRTPKPPPPPPAPSLDLPRIEATDVAPEPPPSRPCSRCWTWADVQAQQAQQRLVEGD